MSQRVRGNHPPAMLGDACAPKGRRLRLVFAADVRGAGAGRGGPAGFPAAQAGCFGVAAERGALSCRYSFVNNKCIHKDGFELLIIKNFCLLIVCKFWVANAIASIKVKNIKESVLIFVAHLLITGHFPASYFMKPRQQSVNLTILLPLHR